MKTVHLRLPATSANLGPGFDAMALALELFLEIDAVPATEFSIHATGRNPNICGGLTRNLLVETYKSVLAFQWAWAADPQPRFDWLQLPSPRPSETSIGTQPGSSTTPSVSKATRTTWRPAGMAA
jgi:hypothetical protein